MQATLFYSFYFLPLFAKVLHIGATQIESAEQTRNRQLLLLLAIFMSFGGITWGSICAAFGLWEAAVIPYGYVVLSVLNVSVLAFIKRVDGVRFFQVLISMMLPFIFQVLLGGFSSSGIVMLWSNLALIGVLALYHAKRGRVYFWLAFYVLLTVGCIFIDPYAQQFKPALFTGQVSVVLTVLNVTMTSCIVFVIAQIMLSKDHKITLELAENQREITEKSKQLSEKNRKITDSIAYASNIQNVILGSEVRVKQFFPNSFVLFKPKDIVSGDFYWAGSTPTGERIIIAADCTGHGVPGAFMTILGSNFLHQIIEIEGIASPREILITLNKRLVHALSTDEGENRIDDGIDLGVLCFEAEVKTQVRFAGARSPLLLVRENGEWEEVAGCRTSLGGKMRISEEEIVEHVIQVTEVCSLYLFSDGYIDQLEGNSSRRYMKSQLYPKLAEIAKLPLEEQKDMLWKNLNEWRDTRPQVDDILLIGISV